VERRTIACPDPTGGARKTSGVGATDHNILRKSGFTVSSLVKLKFPLLKRIKLNWKNTAAASG
jgi:hypothetical protein